MHHTTKRKKLKPAGHSAVIESLIQPAIVVGSTLMSAIAAYVLALDEITRILAGNGTPSDWFIIALCAGMGFLIDMAIIVSATRYKMHAVRDDPKEERWKTLAKWVLGIGLASESMTLLYFFVHLSAAAFPDFLVWIADAIHAVLAVSRGFLPPVVIAYFAAGVLPVMFDRADRNREIKSRTSSNIMLLIDKLSEVMDTDDKAEMLRALGGQLMLATYSEYDETGKTSEDEQLRRDAKLLTHLARIHHLDWSSIAADVAPELSDRSSTTPATMTAPLEMSQSTTTPDDTPDRPPTGPGSPAAAPVRTPRRKAAPVLKLEAPQEWRKSAAQARAKGTTRRGVRTPVPVANYEDQARAAWAEGAHSVGKMERATGMSHSAAQSWVRTLKAETAAMAANTSEQVAQ